MASSDYIPTVYPDISKTDEVLEWTGKERWNAIYTVSLGELIAHDIFSWDSSLLNWSEHAYNEAQYKRVCKYFIERFRFREISIEPYYEWATTLYRKIAFELMPKYKPMYEVWESGFNFLIDSDTYHKERSIGSDYPETLLSSNSDYISDGRDVEYETVVEGDILNKYITYNEKINYVDVELLDNLEDMFIGLYTVELNGV